MLPDHRCPCSTDEFGAHPPSSHRYVPGHIVYQPGKRPPACSKEGEQFKKGPRSLATSSHQRFTARLPQIGFRDGRNSDADFHQDDDRPFRSVCSQCFFHHACDGRDGKSTSPRTGCGSTVRTCCEYSASTGGTAFHGRGAGVIRPHFEGSGER